MRHRAQCLLIDSLTILMVNQAHNGRNYWCLPGGGIDEGETPRQAAIRELKEECELDALELQPVSTITYLDGSIHHTFLVTSYQGTPQPGRDPEFSDDTQVIQAVAWKHIDDLSKLDFGLVAAAGSLTQEQMYRYLKQVS